MSVIIERMGSGSPPGAGGVARSAGVVARSKFSLTTATTRLLLMSDPLRDPAALLSWEGSLFILTSNWKMTKVSSFLAGDGLIGNFFVHRHVGEYDVLHILQHVRLSHVCKFAILQTHIGYR